MREHKEAVDTSRRRMKYTPGKRETFNHAVIHLDPTDRSKDSVVVDGVPMACHYVNVTAQGKTIPTVTLQLLAMVDIEVGELREYLFAGHLPPSEQERGLTLARLTELEMRIAELEARTAQLEGIVSDTEQQKGTA